MCNAKCGIGYRPMEGNTTTMFCREDGYYDQLNTTCERKSSTAYQAMS